jgi:hypothetical protein
MYAPPPRQQVQAPQSDNREAMRRLAEEMKTTAPGGPASALSQPTNPRPAATRAPTGTVAPRTTAPVTPRPRPNVTAPPATPAPVLEKANPAIKITLDAIAKELDDAGSALVTQAKPLLDALDKPPIHTREAIQKRITELGALRTAAKELGIRMGGLKEEAEKKLKADGVDETQAFSAAVRFSFDADGMQRSMACEELARLCEAGREECEYLRENFAKWTSDPDKLVQSKDHMVRARAGQFRMRVEHGLGQREQMEARLRGK